MSLSISVAFVQVIDPDVALGFYRDALGFEVRNDVENAGSRWITVGSSDQPDVSLVLSNYVEGSPDDAAVVAGLVTKGAFGGVHLRASDLDAVFARLVENGAEIVSEPADQPWGARDCAVRDPSGNLIRIDQA